MARENEALMMSRRRMGVYIMRGFSRKGQAAQHAKTRTKLIVEDIFRLHTCLDRKIGGSQIALKPWNPRWLKIGFTPTHSYTMLNSTVQSFACLESLGNSERWQFGSGVCA
jgi:hypothetical protein